MKFSIITCTLNSKKFLSDNIFSAAEQSYKNFEHIFIDSFSEDGTVEIIKKYQKKFPDKVKLFQIPAGGISNAMNEGVRRATGDYLIHLHADDSFYDNNVLSDVASFLEINNYDWAYGKINVINEDKNNCSVVPGKLLRFKNNNLLARYLLKLEPYIPHQAVFIKPSVFFKFGNFDESLSSCMDMDLWLRIRSKTKWGFVDKIISNYYSGPESQSYNSTKIEENKRNYKIVQKRYLNSFDFFIIKIIKLLRFIKVKILKNNTKIAGVLGL